MYQQMVNAACSAGLINIELSTRQVVLLTNEAVVMPYGSFERVTANSSRLRFSRDNTSDLWACRLADGEGGISGLVDDILALSEGTAAGEVTYTPSSIDCHTQRAMAMYCVPEEAVTKEMRLMAKRDNHRRAYVSGKAFVSNIA